MEFNNFKREKDYYIMEVTVNDKNKKSKYYGKIINIKIDAKDFKRVSKYKWYWKECKNERPIVYNKENEMRLARFIMNVHNKDRRKFVKFKSNDITDYRKDNLLFTYSNRDSSNVYRLYKYVFKIKFIKEGIPVDFTFDMEYYDKIKQYRWYLNRKNKYYNIYTKIDGKYYSIYKLLFGNGVYRTYHKNNDLFDCRKENLKIYSK